MFFFRKKRQRVLFDAPVAGQRLGALLERLIGTLPAPEADEVSRVAALCRVLPFVSEKSTQVALHVFLETKTLAVFLTAYGAALALLEGPKAFLSLKDHLTRSDFLLTVRRLSTIKLLSFDQALEEKDFFALLKAFLSLSPSSLWRAQATFLISASRVAPTEFTYARERLFLRTRVVTDPLFDQAIKKLTSVSLVSVVKRVKCSKTGVPYEPMFEIFAPIKSSILTLFAGRNADLLHREKLYLQDDGTLRAKVNLKIGACVFRLPATLAASQSNAFAEILAKTLTLAGSSSREKAFYFVDTRRINRPDSTPHTGPVALFVPLKTLADVSLTDDALLRELAENYCIYSGSEASSEGVVVRYRIGPKTEDRALPYEAAPVSGILFINQARGRRDCATGDITRLLTMERRKLMKDGILTPDAPKGRIHEAKRALDAVLTQQEKILL